VKIIILGAGQVGGTLAEHLADEQNDIHRRRRACGDAESACKNGWISEPF
jgi:Trk K+ transport system NAD-binding subunit